MKEKKTYYQAVMLIEHKARELGIHPGAYTGTYSNYPKLSYSYPKDITIRYNYETDELTVEGVAK